ncbi:hypothetical protein MLD38_023387 [Melastoma candidum]|uniref:Uncharacterized protein n=1 Tax=Melastoma candidum TaxID=119954 RepID=A0ACB9QM90_9MYRT|nr:hypothetical protein MLD38_023387 [Melastoma candidum]
MAVLERQRATLKCHQQQHQQQQQQGIYEDFFGPGINGGGAAFCMTSQGLVVADASNNHPVKLDPGVYDNWPDFGGFCGGPALLEQNYGMVPKNPVASLAQAATTAMSTPVMAAVEKVEECVMGDQKSGRGHGQVGKKGLRKRKVDQLTVVKTEDDNEEKKMRGCTDETESKFTVQSYNNNNDRKNNKKGAPPAENAKSSEASLKQDYIHVRARRGQATDSHSLAERVRREKISERMKFLQDLVPGCNKITGKAGMLDEIINYVQSLQRQVELLSMKLAAVNPRLDIDIDSLFSKEISPACAPNFPAAVEAGGTSELTNQGYIHFNPGNQVVSCLGMELGVNNPDQGLWRTISAPLPATEKFLEAPSFAQMQAQSATTWDDDMSLQQNLYNIEFQQARGLPIPSYLLSGGQLESTANMKLLQM